MTIEREVCTSNAGVSLVGTLLLPGGEGSYPAAMLIPGSGPVDRNSDHRRLALGVTRHLAEALAEVGIASLRYDKRGVGASGGDFMSAGMADNTDDARAMVRCLRDQDVIAADRILVIGHSEGAFHAAILGAETDGLAGVALLSGAARPGSEVLRWQAQALAPTLPTPVRLLMRVLRVDLVEKHEKTVARLRATSGDVERVGGRKHNARWFREFLDADPRSSLGSIEAPVLALTGDKDLQTPPQDVAVIGQAVAAPFEGQVIEGMNHILRPEPGTPSLSNYKKQAAQPLEPQLVRLVTDWAVRSTA